MGDGLHLTDARDSGGEGDSGSEDGSPDQPPGRSSRTDLILSIDDEAGLDDVARAWLADAAHRAVECALKRAGGVCQSGEVRVRVVDDAAMTTLHERHAGESGTTDVLTFDLREDADEPLDADIVVCRDEAQRQATSREITFERELLLYILHGVLHCLGHDDHDDEAYRRMHAEEDAVLDAIGVGRTFAGGAAP